MSLVLQIDGGNTRLKWRVLEFGKCVVAEGAELYSRLDGAEFLGRSCFDGVQRVYFSSVKVCESLRLVLSLWEERIGPSCVVEIDHSKLDATEFAYREFERLGIDRCLAIVGARILSDDACLVLDAGSAITADVVAKDGRHVGGYIFPGVSMLRDSLLGGTSKIIVKEDVEHSLEPGVTTEECVSHALDVMVKSSLEFVMKKTELYGVERIFLTGGDSAYIASLIGDKVEVCRDLIFKGIGHVVAGVGE